MADWENTVRVHGMFCLLIPFTHLTFNIYQHQFTALFFRTRESVSRSHARLNICSQEVPRGRMLVKFGCGKHVTFIIVDFGIVETRDEPSQIALLWYLKIADFSSVYICVWLIATVCTNTGRICTTFKAQLKWWQLRALNYTARDTECVKDRFLYLLGVLLGACFA